MRTASGRRDDTDASFASRRRRLGFETVVQPRTEYRRPFTTYPPRIRRAPLAEAIIA